MVVRAGKLPGPAALRKRRSQDDYGLSILDPGPGMVFCPAWSMVLLRLARSLSAESCSRSIELARPKSISVVKIRRSPLGFGAEPFSGRRQAQSLRQTLPP